MIFGCVLLFPEKMIQKHFQRLFVYPNTLTNEKSQSLKSSLGEL